jgi:Right handed beta helix region
MVLRVLGLIALLTACTSATARGNVLEVGPAQRLKLPSQAAAVAKPGDIIHIAPGTYADCAVWRANQLTIEATGSGAVLADTTCAGKGIFVVTGNSVTVRNLTFAHAAVPDRNGAGIRAEGCDLTIEHSKFIDNENGILASSVAGSVIRIVNSLFRGNGKCGRTCAHGIYVNGIDRLEVEHSQFIDQHVGHHIKSRARSTQLIDNDITDGPDGDSSYLVDIPNGGDLLMQGNRLRKGRHSDNARTVVAIGFEGVKNQTRSLIIRDNTVISDLPIPTVFVNNGTSTSAILTGNHLQGLVKPLEGPGSVNP